MSDALLISVRLHEGWYHGSDKIPSPARMFQALVAGAGISGPLDEPSVNALKWLEGQPPPITASPFSTKGQPVVNFVPNNDLDAKQGDPHRVGEIRTKKLIAPLLFDSQIPFLFAWRLQEENAQVQAEQVLPLANRVYQLGRAVDLAWAWGDILTSEELQERLSSYPGIVRYPLRGLGDVDCPTPGSLESLNRRYNAASQRFDQTADGKGQTFRRRPKPKWKKISYEGVSSRIVLELSRIEGQGFLPWPLERASALVEQLRDRAADRLREALKNRVPDIERTLIGRKSNGENDGPTSARIKIIPLPSIGHHQADMQIRRVLVEIPGDCPLRSDDIAWALSGVRLAHPLLGEPLDVVVSDDEEQLKHFGLANGSRIWRSITPVVLPNAERRRMAPDRKKGDTKEAKGGREKLAEHHRAAFAINQALRHTGIGAKVNSVRFQREPFDLRGSRVEPFAEGTRFSKHSLWHLEVEFESLVSGPFLLGNGRFFGLGLMKPVRFTDGIFAFAIETGLNANPNPVQVARALRSAVMARVRDVLGPSRMPPYFSGHREDGSPARSEEQPHLAFVFDPIEKHLLVVTPARLTKQNLPENEKHVRTLESAIQGIREIRAGSGGVLKIRRTFLDLESHHLLSASNVWESITPYHVNRHARKATAESVLRNDVIAECEKRSLPCPRVSVLKWEAKPGSGLQGDLRLTFKNAIPGPIILGKTRHQGGGVFARVYEPTK